MSLETFPKKFGPYLLLEKVASGGMADVFKAQTPEHQTVALKRLKKIYMYDQDFIDLLSSEAETARDLRHPGLVLIYNFDCIEDYPFLTMEFIDGLSLQHLYSISKNSDRLLPIPMVAFIAREVCRPLDYLHHFSSEHQDKIIHTDLTARNILISREGQVKLIDFSATQTAVNQEQNPTQGYWGRMQDIAPERLQGDPLDVASDVFQLGLILYTQLIGQHPFQGKIGFPLYVAIREVDISEKTLPKTLHPELRNLLIKSLAREPANRFSSAEELGGALEAYLKKEHPDYGQVDLAREVRGILETQG